MLDHQKQKSRVIFGPNVVTLKPSEEFNVLSLSSGKPKRQHALRCLCVMLGPGYIGDVLGERTILYRFTTLYRYFFERPKSIVRESGNLISSNFHEKLTQNEAGDSYKYESHKKR